MADDTEELIDAGEESTIKTSTPRSSKSSELPKFTDIKTTGKQKNKEHKQEDKNSKTLKNSTNIKEQERTQEKVTIFRCDKLKADFFREKELYLKYLLRLVMYVIFYIRISTAWNCSVCCGLI